MLSIDINADLGEGGAADADLMQIITSANISCGAHAGDEQTIRNALRLARDHNVMIGAHPGYADREHFGRRELNLPETELTLMLGEQMRFFARLAREENAVVRYVKPHGALYNQALRDDGLAAAVLSSINEVWPGVSICTIDPGCLAKLAKLNGNGVIAEAFADRCYDDVGRLRSRLLPGAVLGDPEAMISQVLQILNTQTVGTFDGRSVFCRANTVCLHGDGLDAAEMARLLRQKLEAVGVLIRPAVG